MTHFLFLETRMRDDTLSDFRAFRSSGMDEIQARRRPSFSVKTLRAEKQAVSIFICDYQVIPSF